MDDDTQKAVIIILFIAAFLIGGYVAAQAWQRDIVTSRDEILFPGGSEFPKHTGASNPWPGFEPGTLCIRGGWDSNPRL